MAKARERLYKDDQVLAWIKTQTLMDFSELMGAHARTNNAPLIDFVEDCMLDEEANSWLTVEVANVAVIGIPVLGINAVITRMEDVYEPPDSK